VRLRLSVAALRAQYNRAFAPSLSSGRPICELKFTGVKMGVIEMESRAEQAQGYWKEAERYAELASSGQRDITNFVHKRLAELRSDLLAWPRIWSVSGVSELVGAS
jgi:hypothetical protein